MTTTRRRFLGAIAATLLGTSETLGRFFRPAPAIDLVPTPEPSLVRALQLGDLVGVDLNGDVVSMEDPNATTFIGRVTGIDIQEHGYVDVQMVSHVSTLAPPFTVVPAQTYVSMRLRA